MAQRPRAWAMPVLMVLSCCLLVVGCGGSGHAGTDSARPERVNGTVSRFDDLPRYPRSRALGPRTRNDNGVLTQSFAVSGATPDVIVEYLIDVLPRHGWHAVNPPSADGEATRRGVWQDGQLHLVVATSPAPTLPSSDAATQESQYSFLLYPAGVPVESAATQ